MRDQYEREMVSFEESSILSDGLGIDGCSGSAYQCCGIGGFISVILTIIGIYIFKPMDPAYAEKMFAGVEAPEE